MARHSSIFILEFIVCCPEGKETNHKIPGENHLCENFCHPFAEIGGGRMNETVVSISARNYLLAPLCTHHLQRMFDISFIGSSFGVSKCSHPGLFFQNLN